VQVMEFCGTIQFEDEDLFIKKNEIHFMFLSFISGRQSYLLCLAVIDAQNNSILCR
jgi:hypothetical protein